jgi:hypothetical protein
MPDTDSRPEKDQGSDQKTTAPASGDAGEAESKPTEAPSQSLPDSLKDKSPDEISKMYINLEKKMGEQSGEVESARKLKEQTETLLRAVWSDPDLYRQVETGIQKYVSGGSIPDTRQKAKKPDDKKGDGEDKGLKEVNPEITDLRKAEENRVLNDFFGKFGYNNLEQKAREEKYSKLAVSLAELVDPKGKRPIKEILSSIPLTKLPQFLENAHFIAHKEELVEQGKRSAILSQRENSAASIGSLAASSSGKSDGVTLSKSERETAQKMGISEEKYALRKAEMLAEASRFE